MSLKTEKNTMYKRWYLWDVYRGKVLSEHRFLSDAREALTRYDLSTKKTKAGKYYIPVVIRQKCDPPLKALRER